MDVISHIITALQVKAHRRDWRDVLYNTLSWAIEAHLARKAIAQDDTFTADKLSELAVLLELGAAGTLSSLDQGENMVRSGLMH